MEKIHIICVDDEREVLDSVAQDLELLTEVFTVELCESAEECLELMDEIDAEDDHVAVVISDQVMPEKSGVELLTEIAEDSRFKHTKKLLLTGLATQADTIKAINQAQLDNYLEKVWQPEILQLLTKQLLTRYIVEKGIDYQPYVSHLDAPTLFKLLQ